MALHRRPPWSRTAAPYSHNNRDIFSAATSVHVGDGCKVEFRDFLWLKDLRPGDVASKILDLSRKKSCTVQRAL